jgi:uncharacterized protein (DUF1499 family)
MKNPRTITMLLAVIALAMVVLAGPGSKYGWWSWETAFTVLQWGTYVGFVAAAAAAVLVAMLALPRWRSRPWVPLTALIVALLAIAPPLILRQQAKGVPPIHDISTDTLDPPVFVALLAERQKSPNGADYGGPGVAAQQQKAYPEIKPLVLKTAPAETVQLAIDAARSLGWEVAASHAASGRIEATATTTWFGFKDDVVIRVRPDGTGGSRVDVRSVSRVGVSDLGANARRVREFLAKLG